MSLVHPSFFFKERHLVNNLLKMDSTNQFYQRTTADAEFGYQNEFILLGMMLSSTCSAKL